LASNINPPIGKNSGGDGDDGDHPADKMETWEKAKPETLNCSFGTLSKVRFINFLLFFCLRSVVLNMHKQKLVIGSGIEICAQPIMGTPSFSST